MADAFDVLAQGYAPTSIGTVFTASGSTVVKSMRVTNVGAATTLSIGVNGTTNDKLIMDAQNIADGDRGVDDTISLANGDTITMLAGDANRIAYTIMGIKVT